MNESFKYEFNEVKFYEYSIRMTKIDNTEMYLVSDLLKQYNEINHTDKRINKWLTRIDTQELLQFCRDNNFGDRKSAPENIEEYFSDIPNVIMKIDYKINNNITNKAYIVNSIILHDILMWVDKVFAYKVCNFLENMREINNDRFTEILNTNKDQEKQIELLQDHVNKLQDRYIINDDTQQWTYVLKISKNDEDGLYHIKSRYSRCKYINKDDEMNEVYYIRNLPNGYTFKYFAYEHLLPIIRQYNGYEVSNQRSHFVIPADSYDKDDKHLDYLIRNALKQTRIDLCWKIC